jgi:hypothetical protein
LAKENSGIRRTFWIPKELDEKAEALRKQLGLGRSGFYRFAIVELLKNMIISQPQTQQTRD